MLKPKFARRPPLGVQLAVSRHIARLENRISVRVFRPSRAGVRLTEAGSRLYEAVAGGLGEIESAIAEIAEMPDKQHVAIACSHDAWQLLFMPERDALRESLGENAPVRFSLGAGDPRDAAPDPAPQTPDVDEVDRTPACCEYVGLLGGVVGSRAGTACRR